MKVICYKFLIIINLCLVGINPSVIAKDTTRSQILSTHAQTIHIILNTPTDKTDLARVKLTIDKMIDPSIDVDASMDQLDHMVRTINRMAGVSATSMQKMLAVRKFIYESGTWNNHRPFHYDHDDPFGLKISNKLMTNYISNRSGNCITMPFLFILLADKMGLNVTAST